MRQNGELQQQRLTRNASKLAWPRPGKRPAKIPSSIGNTGGDPRGHQSTADDERSRDHDRRRTPPHADARSRSEIYFDRVAKSGQAGLDTHDLTPDGAELLLGGTPEGLETIKHRVSAKRAVQWDEMRSMRRLGIQPVHPPRGSSTPVRVHPSIPCPHPGPVARRCRHSTCLTQPRSAKRPNASRACNSVRPKPRRLGPEVSVTEERNSLNGLPAVGRKTSPPLRKLAPTNISRRGDFFFHLKLRCRSGRGSPAPTAPDKSAHRFHQKL